MSQVLMLNCQVCDVKARSGTSGVVVLSMPARFS